MGRSKTLILAITLAMYSPALKVWGNANDTIDPIISCNANMGNCDEPVLKFNKIDYRTDLTRIYCTLNGQPHTAHRIDCVMLLLPDGHTYKATDIDGIDFRRYFQFEDNGTITLEIDFEQMNGIAKGSVLQIEGPHGSCNWTLE